MHLTLGVLLCDNVAPDIAEAAGGGYREMFADLFEKHAPEGSEVELRFYDAIRGEYPEDLAECDGYLTSGSAVSVNDSDVWIAEFENFIRRLHRKEVKLFGICFGHQMIARALGGKVEVAAQGWGVGVHQAAIIQRKEWMTPPADFYRLISSHQEQVTELPENAKVLATTPHCPVAMFHCGSTVGVQGHPEFHPTYAQALLDLRKKIIPTETRSAASASLAHEPDHALLVAWIIEFMKSQ